MDGVNRQASNSGLIERQWGMFAYNKEYFWFDAQDIREWPLEIPQECQSLTILAADPFTIPVSIRDLVKLKYLTLDLNNEGIEIPAVIGEMTQLEELFISGTDINHLDLGKLNNLKKLYLFDTGLTEVPRWIRSLTNIRDLSLCNNQIREVPDWLITLRSTVTVDLRNNLLSNLDR